MVDIDWQDALRVYRDGLDDGADPMRVVRRYLGNRGRSASLAAEVLAELERRHAAEPEPVETFPPPDPPPPEPAPTHPPPADAPQAEPVGLPTVDLMAPLDRTGLAYLQGGEAILTRADHLARAYGLPPSEALAHAQEPPMSASPDFAAALLRALPAALSLYRVALDDGAIGEIADAIDGVAKRARRLSKRGPLTTETRGELRYDAREQIRCVLPDLPEAALETLGEVVIDAIDEHTNTGPLEEVDGEIAKRGLAALDERIELWSLDAGNLEARVQRAQRRAAKAQAEADRLQAILEKRQARG